MHSVSTWRPMCRIASSEIDNKMFLMNSLIFVVLCTFLNSGKGWFAMVSEDGHTAGYFSTVEQVALARVPHFLCAQGSILCYKLMGLTRDTGKAEYSRTTIGAGFVLRFLGVYEDINVQGRMSFRSFAQAKKHQSVRYAKCIGPTGDILYVPLNVKGKFYAAAGSKRVPSVDYVFTLSQLLSLPQKVPITVRLIVGPLPRLPCGFTGFLRLDHVQRQEVVLACTTRDSQPVLLEIDTRSTFSFVPETDPRRLRGKVYDKMLQHCILEADRWRTEIKIAHQVQTPNLPLPHWSLQNQLAKSPSKASDHSSGVASNSTSASTGRKTSSMSSLRKLMTWSFKAGSQWRHRQATRPMFDGSEEAENEFHINRREMVSRLSLGIEQEPESDHIYESIPRPPRHHSAGAKLTVKSIHDIHAMPPDDGYGTSKGESVYDTVDQQKKMETLDRALQGSISLDSDLFLETKIPRVSSSNTNTATTTDSGTSVD